MGMALIHVQQETRYIDCLMCYDAVQLIQGSSLQIIMPLVTKPYSPMCVS